MAQQAQNDDVQTTGSGRSPGEIEVELKGLRKGETFTADLVPVEDDSGYDAQMGVEFEIIQTEGCLTPCFAVVRQQAAGMNPAFNVYLHVARGRDGAIVKPHNDAPGWDVVAISLDDDPEPAFTVGDEVLDREGQTSGDGDPAIVIATHATRADEFAVPALGGTVAEYGPNRTYPEDDPVVEIVYPSALDYRLNDWTTESVVALGPEGLEENRVTTYSYPESRLRPVESDEAEEVAA